MAKILTHELIDKMSDREIIDLMQSTKIINKARLAFSHLRSTMDRASRQQGGLDPLSMRRLEFKACIELGRVFGINELSS